MKIPTRLLHWLARWAIRLTIVRRPDFVVRRDDGSVYLNRWWIIPRNPVANIYLHEFLADDDPRALHDHPWVSCSLVLHGQYREILPLSPHQQPGWDYLAGHTRTVLREAGQLIARRPRLRHRLELVDHQPCYTLFFTGPVVREWGFHCRRGWVPWTHFTRPGDAGSTGPGCAGESRRPLSIWRVWRGRGA